MSAEALIGASLIVFLAFFVRGIWGFGSATIAIPPLAHFIVLKVIGTLLIVSGGNDSQVCCPWTKRA